MNKKTAIIIIFVIVGTVGLAWAFVSLPSDVQNEYIARGAIHWHPEVTVYVKGEKQELPPNIGIGAVHQPIHTHDDSDQGIVHMEFSSSVRKQDATLGKFFQNWGQDMRAFGSNMRMTVNGEENAEYGNYVMRDQDKIELWFD